MPLQRALTASRQPPDLPEGGLRLERQDLVLAPPAAGCHHAPAIAPCQGRRHLLEGGAQPQRAQLLVRGVDDVMQRGLGLLTLDQAARATGGAERP